MRDRDRLCPLRPPCPRGDLVNGVKYIRAIIAIPAPITDAYRHILQDDKAVLMLERLPFHEPWLHRALAVFA
jgi:hypothetical protein